METTLPVGTVTSLLDLADAAGLADGTLLPVEPSPHDAVDGGWTIVTRRSEHGIGQVVADQLGSEDAPGSSERRSLLSQLVRHVPSNVDGTWRAIPIERWAIQSSQPLADLGNTHWPWPHLDPNSVSWQFNADGVRCAIVTDSDWPYTSDEANDYQALTSGLFRRPLLPHESSCDDVFAWRDTLGMSRTMIIAPTGLDHQQ